MTRAFPLTTSFLAVSLIISGIAARIGRLNSPLDEEDQENGRNLALGMGNIGCTFSNSVCDPKLEFCYNDNAFGRCLTQFGSSSESSLYRYSLSKSDMHLLEREIERLFAEGYRWGHSYTQCVLQNLLNALRQGLDLEKSVVECTEDQDQDLKGAMKAFADEVNPWDLAFIKYEPANSEPASVSANAAHASDFANELYAPSKLETYEMNPENLSTLEELRSKGNSPSKAGVEQENLLDALLHNYLLQELGRPIPKKDQNTNTFINSKNAANEQFENFPEWQEDAIDDDKIGLNINEKVVQPRVFSTLYNTPELFRNGIETRDGLGFLDEISNYVQPDISKMTKSDTEKPEFQPQLEYLEKESGENDQITLSEKEIEELEEALITKSAIAQLEDEVEKERRKVESSQFGSGRDGAHYTEGGLVFLNNNPKRFYFEEDDEEEDEDGLGVGFDNRNGFERRERLDVKKPGPWYRTVNNFAFDDKEEAEEEKGKNWEEESNQFNSEFGGLGPADMNIHKSLNRIPPPVNILEKVKPRENRQQKGEEMGELMKIMTKKAGPMALKPVKETMIGKDSGDFDDQLDIIDTSYVNVFVANRIGGWNQAQDLVNLLADLLDLKHSTFIEVRQTDDVVTFKVGPNDKKLNSTQIALRIEKLSQEVEKESGVKIVRARVGIRTNKQESPIGLTRRFFDADAGDSIPNNTGTGTGQYPNSSLDQGNAEINYPSNFPAQLPLYAADSGNNSLYIATFATCGLVAAILVAAFTIFFIRKNAKSKEKFARLAQDDPSMEACRDYQDLCRARMASKNNEKTEPLRAVQRVQSHTSRDSETGGTSSSRSSTSSWTEEPVHTNMDISTGHMVLSYMEDHLKNKDRLDQEWAALCAYEADPGATSIAEKPENSKKNRYSNSLPYDHSRVILNDLANISGSDYINASTITDHDPRNPAYIATQGPMANTAADFWQMVWEQGSVVIVSLSRLSDNGTTLCHRYWPEEGSELLHIYEVHLVSEHIWCEEYLVRSFYLKNVKTGETRTVTQFQFLAWPENGIPTSTKSILEFRRKVNKSYRGRSCPIIVHCSDGAGRSGTYCLIDMVLNRMRKGAKEIDIAASLEHIRDQRQGMVRTKQQFEFVLMAVAEEVHAILKALPQ